MKHLSLILLTSLTLALLTTSAMASEPSSSHSKIRKEVRRSMAYPRALESQRATEIVLVSFRIERCGTVSVLEVNASNEAFASYVLAKLEAMRFQVSEAEELNMRFTFHSARKNH